MVEAGVPGLQGVEARVASRSDEARTLARMLGVEVLGPGRPPRDSFRLVLLEDAIELWDHDCVRRGNRVDFTTIDTRVGGGNLSKSQPLARSMGSANGLVVDATAGFGHDAALLACMGYDVLAIERSPLVQVLLQEALERAIIDPRMNKALGGRLRVVQADALETIPGLDPPPTVIYMDPMFNPKKPPKALPRKPAQILRRIVGHDSDAEELLTMAINVAKRVVVKRADGAEFLGMEPTHSISGKQVRYDVYLRDGSG